MPCDNRQRLTKLLRLINKTKTVNVRFSDTPISALAPPHVEKSSKIKRFQAFMRWGPARGDKKVLKFRQSLPLLSESRSPAGPLAALQVLRQLFGIGLVRGRNGAEIGQRPSGVDLGPTVSTPRVSNTGTDPGVRLSARWASPCGWPSRPVTD